MRTTDAELAAFSRRYNEHRLDDLDESVAPDVVINGVQRGLHASAEEPRSVVGAFPDYST